MIQLQNIKTPQQFGQEIEEIVWTKDTTYMEAVCLYCETNNVEPETAASLIKLNAVLKLKIQIEAENLNFLPKIQRLPI